MYPPITRRRLLIKGGKAVLAASLADSLLAACGNTNTGGGSTGGSNGVTPVDYWQGIDKVTLRNYFMDHDVKPFNQTHPHIQIQASFKPIDTIDRLIQTALASGKGPDLVPTPGPSYVLQYVNAGLILDLDQYAQQYNWQNKILPWALESGRVKGKLYSLPTSYETMLLYYNKTLFQQKGWKVPTNRSELEALATEAQGQGIQPFIAGNAEWRPATEWFVTVFLNHYSGPHALYQALTGQLSWTDPVFVDAITLMKQYFQKGWFGGSVQKFFSNRFDPIDSMLGNGKAAMDMEGSWQFQNWPNFFGPKGNNNNDWDWAPIPPLRADLPSPIFALGIGSTLSIKARTKVANAAATYLDWEFSDPKRVGQEMADVYNEPLPIHLTPTDIPASADKRFPLSYVALNQATAQGVFGYTTWTFWPPKSDVWVYQGMEKVLTGDMTPAAYLAQLDQIFKQELAKGVVPPIPKGKNG